MISPRTLSAALLGSALVGAGAGAGIYASTGTHRTVTVAAPAAASASQVAQTSSTQPVGQIYRKAGDGVVEIVASSSGGSSSPFPYGGSGSQAAEGSGFVYDDKGDIFTNQHVIGGADSVTVKLADGSTYKATVVGSDASTDLAVVKIDAPASALHPLQLADSSKLSVGDGVVAIGSPFGLQGSVTSGIVSALHREISAPDSSPIEDAIQTDAAINHGNSGGPLLDLQGSVVGVTAQIDSDSGGNDGVGFAIPSNTVRSVVAQLLASGKAQHALLGVDVQTISQQAAAGLGVSAGVEIESVQSGSAADGAGLRGSTGHKTVGGQSYPTGGDVITAADGTAVTTAQQLRGLIAAKKPGDSLELTIERGGKTQSVKVTLGSRSA
ncbi:MAG TPA: trypsin-like peptidase domain-containing protein [Gaiellaceae bacterium]|jgi:putative serine protease PepD